MSHPPPPLEYANERPEPPDRDLLTTALIWSVFSIICNWKPSCAIALGIPAAGYGLYVALRAVRHCATFATVGVLVAASLAVVLALYAIQKAWHALSEILVGT